MRDKVGSLVVDVDGTLCPIKRPEERYEDLAPYGAIVEMLRKRQREGFQIVLHTSRNVRTHKGQIGLLNRHTLPALMAWVERWNIPCDAVIVGKPWPGKEGYYIDDRAVRPSEFLTHSHEELKTMLIRDREQFEKICCGQDGRTNIVITMAGRGSRFRDAGYSLPKYEVEVGGRTLFEWSLLSLNQFFQRKHRLIFVLLAELKAEEFVRNACAAIGLKPSAIVQLPTVTDGQATSALAANDDWCTDDPLLIYNIDTFVEPQSLSPADIPQEAHGWVPCFQAQGDHWSFIRLADDSEWAVEVAEKRRISPNATVGLYWFSSAGLYQELYRKHFKSGEGEEAGERYIAPIYNSLIAQGGRLGISLVDQYLVHPLGTPHEVNAFRPPQDLLIQK